MGKQWNTIIYSNILPIILLSVFLIIIIYNSVFNKNKTKLFILSTLIIIMMLIVKSADYLLSYQEGEIYATFRNITTFINFSSAPLVPLLLYKISSQKTNTFKLYIPLISNIIVCLLSIPFGYIFSINSMNIYERGPLFFFPFVITIFYLFIVIIQNKDQLLKSKNSERIFLLFTIILISVFMLIEVVFGFYFVSWTSAAIVFPLYYLLLNVNHSIIDPLTNAYNRLMYTMDLEKMNKNHNYLIALLDLNYFKNVNDQYGHDAGDQALIYFTKTVSHYIPKSVSLYRIGGDEFVLLSKKDIDIEKISQCLNEARKDTQKHLADFSYGIDIFDHSTSLNDFLNHIDQLMYENKKIDKQRKQQLI